MALNAKMKERIWMSNRKKMWLWTLKWECGSERQNEDEQRLWMPNKKCGSKRQNEVVALNAKQKNVTLDIDLKV